MLNVYYCVSHSHLTGYCKSVGAFLFGSLVSLECFHLSEFITVHNRLSICSPGWPGICNVDQAGLTFVAILPGASQNAGLQA